jgi:large conductance mechanosensitive channel
VIKGFRDFILRGNVIELAVAVVIGTAFNSVVTQFSKSFIEPVIRLLSGGSAFSGIWYLKGKKGAADAVAIDFGAFLNALLAFFITAAVVYFIFVYPMNRLAERRKRGESPEPEAPSDEVRLLTEIRDALVAGNGQFGDRHGGAPVRPEPPNRR